MQKWLSLRQRSIETVGMEIRAEDVKMQRVMLKKSSRDFPRCQLDVTGIW